MLWVELFWPLSTCLMPDFCGCSTDRWIEILRDTDSVNFDILAGGTSCSSRWSCKDTDYH